MSSSSSPVLQALLDPQHLIHSERLCLAFYRKGNERFRIDLILHPLIGLPADQNLILGAILLDAFRRVDAVADGCIFESFFRADPPQHGFAIMDPHTEIEMSFRG